ncbi:hypothetical protein [Microbacterium oleivorans]|uniref:hypothetical protein n=1 Tax=Microbacterium oleivorans TaxID=273677 RepID=UPI00166F969E|nr:hypothetical protein [Microbacterium oleivorans]
MEECLVEAYEEYARIWLQTHPPAPHALEAPVSSVPRLFKVVEVAERLGAGVDWVYARIQQGELAVIELGDTRKNQRVGEDALAAFLTERTHGGAEK